MKKLFILIFILFSGVIYAQNTHITIVHINDTHSHLDAFGPKDQSHDGTIGGIGKAATIIKSIRLSESNVLFLHAGDFSVGDFFYNKYFGVPELQMLAELGCTALTVGNHEFDLGPFNLLAVLQQGFQTDTFPLLSANLDMTGLPQLETFVHPYIMKNISGVKVGIFGMTIPNPLNNPSPIIVENNFPEIANATVTALQSAGANVVIMLSHLGYSNDSALAVNIPGINFIVGGHDHYVFTQPKVLYNPGGFNTYIVQAGADYEFVGKLKFTYNNGTITFNSYNLIPADIHVPPDPGIQMNVDYLKDGIILQYGDVYFTKVGTAQRDITMIPNAHNKHYMDTPMGNLVTDSYRYKTHTDIAITANGMMAQQIYKGFINASDVFHVVPYGFDTATGLGFNLLKMKIKGSELIKGLEFSLSMPGIYGDYFVQISGFKFKYNSHNPIGSRVIISSIKIDGKHINLNKNYSLTLNEAVYSILSQAGVVVSNPEPAGIPEYTALKNYIAKLKTVNYESEGRIFEKIPGHHHENDEDEIADYVDDTDPDEESNTPLEITSYKLYDNYPNPFNPSTTIRYDIKADGFVSLKIYNVAGQEVLNISPGYIKAGSYSYIWNAGNYASGVYFYRLSSGSFTETKRMILVK
jgi:2',3'-cyclic-nucleotide 2'-phosphodiesterase (5'-nucleotidase family)